MYISSALPRPRSPSLNSSGQSLIQLMVTMAIMSALMVAFMTMMDSQSRETRALTDKMAALDLQRLLQLVLANGTVCQFLTNNNGAPLTFNASSLPQVITLPSVAGQPPTIYSSILPAVGATPATPVGAVAQVGGYASAISNSLKIGSIQLQVTQGGSGAYVGNWLVSFDPSTSLRPLQPVSIATTLSVNDTVPASAFISACAGQGAGLGPYHEGTLVFPGLGTGGWMHLDPTLFPSTGTTNGDTYVSDPYTFTPLGNRVEIVVSPILGMTSGSGEYGLGIETGLHFNPAMPVIGEWTPGSGWWFSQTGPPAVSPNINVQSGGLQTARYTMTVVPGTTYSIEFWIMPQCGPVDSCGNVTAATMGVYSPIPITIQEYY